jgi:hypothetical protein
MQPGRKSAASLITGGENTFSLRRALKVGVFGTGGSMLNKPINGWFVLGVILGYVVAPLLYIAAMMVFYAVKDWREARAEHRKMREQIDERIESGARLRR